MNFGGEAMPMAAGAWMDDMVMDEAMPRMRERRMFKNAIAPVAPHAPPAEEEDDEGGAPKKQDSTDKDIIEEDEAPEDDFQHVTPGSREYSHHLRRGYNKFSPRIDFTQTLMFQSGKELKDLGRNGRILTSAFDLNDQVS